MKKASEFLPKTSDEMAQAEAQIVDLSKRIEFYLTEYSVELCGIEPRPEEAGQTNIS